MAHGSQRCRSAHLGLLAEEAERSEIDQHHVGVGAAADDPDPAVGERGGERSRVLDDALSVGPELRAKGFAQAHRLGALPRLNCSL